MRRIPSSTSRGSNPVTTIGTWYFSTSGSYSQYPITEQTWPAARNPCTRVTGESMIAEIAGGTSTWDTSIEKLLTPSRFAWCTAMALAGAVVSKPMPKNTTCRSGFSRAIRTASRGE